MIRKKLNIIKNGKMVHATILRNKDSVTVMTERVFEDVEELPKGTEDNILLMANGQVRLVSSVESYEDDFKALCDVLKKISGDKSRKKTPTKGDLKKGVIEGSKED